MSQTFWRLTKAKYALAKHNGPLSGYGSMIHGGRWHPRGRPVVYAADSAALALLETLVHIERSELLQFDYMVIPVTIPDALYEDKLIEEMPQEMLPPDWQAWPYPYSTQFFGQRWFDSQRSVALVVPSVVVPHERNVLLNPLHPRFSELEIRDPEPFPIDMRLSV